MSKKYLNRLAARVAREKLKESKNWLVTKKIILETNDDMDIGFEKGEMVEIGATEEGDLAIKSPAAVVLISDEDLATKIADIVVSSDELSDVKFVDKSALDAALDGEDVEDIVDKLADGDEDSENIEAAVVDVETKESVDSKFTKFASHKIKTSKAVFCETLHIDEEDETSIDLSTVEDDSVAKEDVTDYDQFTTRVSELGGSIQPGVKEVALNTAGKVIGTFDKEGNVGVIYPENEFDSAEDMDNFDDSPEALVQDIDLEVTEPMNMGEAEENISGYGDGYDPEFPWHVTTVDGDGIAGGYATKEEAEEEKDRRQTADTTIEYKVAYITNEDYILEDDLDTTVDSELGMYEESTKTGKDYIKLVNGLTKAKLTESTIAKIVSTFDTKSLKECVRVFDTKYGKYVSAFKEAVDADNFIAESSEEKRFTKRYFNG